MEDALFQDIELQLLLETIKLRYGYDFSNYAPASLKRRIDRIIIENSLEHYSELIPLLIHNPSKFLKFLDTISVPVTEMFRDPDFFRFLRSDIIPLLRKKKKLNFWIAGCATGEEVYSLAILLKEMRCYKKSSIVATDFAPSVVLRAQEGFFSDKNYEKYQANYISAGGNKSLMEYVVFRNGNYIFKPLLRKNLSFTSHNLVHDSAMQEINLISCRNVLIYFNNLLQNNVLTLFEQSLVNDGILCLGTKETMRFSDSRKNFKEISENLKIYQKIETKNDNSGKDI